VDVPLRVLRLHEDLVGGPYLFVDIALGARTLTMLLDSGLTHSVMLTPLAHAELGLASGPTSESVGVFGSATFAGVQLDDVGLLTKDGEILPLGSMDGVVADIPQRRLGLQVGVRVDGMLGQGFLARCDVELDAGLERLRVWPPGLQPDVQPGWTRLSALRLPADLQGLVLTVPGSLEPVVGIVDTGASHTILNNRAAKALGLALPSLEHCQPARGVGIDGAEFDLPLVDVTGASLSGASDINITDRTASSGGLERSWSFEIPQRSGPEIVGPLARITLAIGDIALFEELLTHPQDSIGRFVGPVALLGQDLLSQRPLRISARSLCVHIAQPPQKSGEKGLRPPAAGVAGFSAFRKVR